MLRNTVIVRTGALRNPVIGSVAEKSFLGQARLSRNAGQQLQENVRVRSWRKRETSALVHSALAEHQKLPAANRNLHGQML